MSDADTSMADQPYKSHEEFLQEKDDLMAQYWLDPYANMEESRTDVAAAVAVSIFSIIVIGAVFLAIFWLANHAPAK